MKYIVILIALMVAITALTPAVKSQQGTTIISYPVLIPTGETDKYYRADGVWATVGAVGSTTNYFSTIIVTNLTVENLNVTTNITQTLIVTNITIENNTIFKGKVTIQKGVENYQGVLTHAGTVTLDFDPAQLTTKSVSLTGNITFAFTNLATNRNYRVLLQNTQATNCTITWPSGVHGYYSTIISNNTWGMAALEAWGSVDTNVWVSTSNDGTYTP